MAAARSTAAAAEFSRARRTEFFGEDERPAGPEDEQALMNFRRGEEEAWNFGRMRALIFEQGGGKVGALGEEGNGDVMRRKEEEGSMEKGAEFMAKSFSGSRKLQRSSSRRIRLF